MADKSAAAREKASRVAALAMTKKFAVGLILPERQEDWKNIAVPVVKPHDGSWRRLSTLGIQEGSTFAYRNEETQTWHGLPSSAVEWSIDDNGISAWPAIISMPDKNDTYVFGASVRHCDGPRRGVFNAETVSPPQSQVVPAPVAKPPEPSKAPKVTATSIFSADTRRALQERRDLTMAAHLTAIHVDMWRQVVNLAVAPAWHDNWTSDAVGSRANIDDLVKTVASGNHIAEVNKAALGCVNDELAPMGFEICVTVSDGYVMRCRLAK